MRPAARGHLHADRRRPATAGSSAYWTDESAADFGTLDCTAASLIRPWVAGVSADELELVRVTEYTFRAQLADRWRRGNVFLLGDAAHLTPPFVGQGLGAGLRDAMNLAWKLAGVVGATFPLGVLDTYEQERKPHARQMIRLALGVGRAMTAGGELGNLIRRVVVPRLQPHSRPSAPSCSDSQTPRAAPVGARPRREGPRLAGTTVPQSRCWRAVAGSTRARDGFAVVSADSAECGRRRTRRAARRRSCTSPTPEGELAEWLRRGRATVARHPARPDRHATGTTPAALFDTLPALLRRRRGAEP